MICVLQFDAASVALLDRLLDAGRLPHLAGLIERGRRIELQTPAVDFAAGAFYTLYSGVELADHGIFYPFQWDAGAQRARYARAFEAPPAVWEHLAAADLRTLVTARRDMQMRTFKTLNGLVGFLYDLGVKVPSVPMEQGMRATQPIST